MLSSISKLTKLEWADGMIRKLAKSFDQGDLVWKLVLPIGTKDPKFSKWSPTWEGPYKISRCVPGNAYIWRHWKEKNFSVHLMASI